MITKRERWFEKEDSGLYQTDLMINRTRSLYDMVAGSASDFRRLTLRFAILNPRVSVVLSVIRLPHEIDENVISLEADSLSQVERIQIDKHLTAIHIYAPKWSP